MKKLKRLSLRLLAALLAALIFCGASPVASLVGEESASESGVAAPVLTEELAAGDAEETAVAVLGDAVSAESFYFDASEAGSEPDSASVQSTDGAVYEVPFEGSLLRIGFKKQNGNTSHAGAYHRIENAAVELSSGLAVLEAYWVDNARGNDYVIPELTALPTLEVGQRLAIYGLSENVAGGFSLYDYPVLDYMNVADSAMLPLSWYSGFALVLISEYEESELFVEVAEGTEASFGGLLPVDASVEIEELAYDAVDGCETVMAFDISILDGEGEPWQPLDGSPIAVTLRDERIASALERAKYLRVLHVKDAENGIVEEASILSAEGDTLVFEATGFSDYVVQIVLEKTLVASDGNTYTISVTYTTDSGLPEDAELLVSEVTGTEEELAEYVSETAEALYLSPEDLGYTKLFDISIVDKDGVEHQPNRDVSVAVELMDAAAEDTEDLRVVHFGAENKELDSTVEGSTLSFTTDGFSIFSFTDVSLLQRIIQAVLGKSDNVLYENDDIVLSGRMPLLGQVVAEPVTVEIDGKPALVAYDIKIYSNPLAKLLGITWQPTAGAIQVTVKSDALAAQAGELGIYHLEDGSAYPEHVATVEAVDSAVTFDAESFSTYAVSTVIEKTIVAEDGSTYKITVAYDESAGIPADASLEVSEVSSAALLETAAAAVGSELSSLSYAKLFNISIVKDGVEYQPNDKVTVTVELLDAADVSDVRVVHFESETEAEPLDAETNGRSVTFETEGFSVFSFLDFSVFDKIITAVLGETEGVLYENDDIILMGRMPSSAVVEAERVDVKIKGKDALVAYDIVIYAHPIMKLLGIRWQPTDGALQVTLRSDALEGKKNLAVYHMANAEAEPEFITNVPQEDSSVTFEAESFSIYPVSEAEQKPRIFYTFYNGSSVVAKEYLTSASEFYDPGVTPDYGQTFLGWAFDAAETDESQMFTWEELKTKLAENWGPAPTYTPAFTDGTEINVYARFKEAYYLRYMVMDGDGNVGVLKSDSVRVDAADLTKTVQCEYDSSGEIFEGWIDAATGTTYENGETLTLDHHIDLYAKVRGRNWLIFNANMSGATFTGPQLIYGDYHTQKPADPTRRGYTFLGWNESPDGSGAWWSRTDDPSVNLFGGTINADTNLYAQWSGDANTYTILYWKQRASDEVGLANEDKTYDLAGSETVSANVFTGDAITEDDLPAGWNTKGTNNDSNSAYYQTHYSWNDLTEETAVADDGSTIVNVYYDREIYSLLFEINSGNLPRYQRDDTNGEWALVNGEMVHLSQEDGQWMIPVYGDRYTTSSSEEEEMYGLIDGVYVPLDPEPVYTYSYTRQQFTEAASNDTSTPQYALLDGADGKEYVELTKNATYTRASGNNYKQANNNNGTQFGTYNNTIIPLYYTSGGYGTREGWYRTRTEYYGYYYYSNQYNGTRYTQGIANNVGNAYTGTVYYIGSGTSGFTSEGTPTGTLYGRSGTNNNYTYFPLNEVATWTYTRDGVTETYTGTRYKENGTVAYSGERSSRSGSEWWARSYTPTTVDAASGQWGLDDRGGRVALAGTPTRTGYTYSYNGVPYPGTRYTKTSGVIIDHVPYDGPRYSQVATNGWHTIYVIEALYGHDVSSDFPISGWNGTTYDGYVWEPQNSRIYTSGDVPSVDSMQAENTTFHAKRYGTTITIHMYYYTEALGNEADDVITVVSNGKTYVEHRHVTIDSNGGINSTEAEDFVQIIGYSHERSDPQYNNGVVALNRQNNYTIKFYYTRNKRNIQYYSNGEVVSTTTNVPYEANVKPYADAQPIPTNGEDGTYFDGWYEDPDCKVPVRADLTMPDGDVILYAKWSTFRVRVVFVPGCTDFWFANNQATKFRTDYGESISFGNVKPGVAKRPGYTLVGWYLNPDFSGNPIITDQDYPISLSTPGLNMDYQNTADWASNTYGDNDGAHENVKGILKFYAKWQLSVQEGMVYFLYEVEDGYCIFDAAGDRQTYVPVDPIAHAIGTDVEILEAPSGYVAGVDFVNWMVLNKNGGATGITYNPRDSVRLEDSAWWSNVIDVVPMVADNGDILNMKVVRLRARFTAEEEKATTITFYGNGGKMGEQTSFTQVVPLNATVDLAVESASFTREHYTLIGWNTEADGSGRSFATDEEIYANNEGGENKLYAQWMADIEIVANGPQEEVIFDNEEHSNIEDYTFTYTLGGVPVAYTEETVTEGGVEYVKATLTDYGLVVKIRKSGWPVATGQAKGSYTARDLTDAELEALIIFDETQYHEAYNVKRVYNPATLLIRDLMLTITKTVTGDFADMTKQFTFTLVSVEGMTSGTFAGTIYRSLNGQTYVSTFSIGGTFRMMDGDIVRIEGLPKNKQVTFSEDNGYYTTTWTQDSETPITGSFATVSFEADSVLAVVNNLDPPAPTDVVTRDLPYALMALGGIAVLAVLALPALRRRRKGGEGHE